MPDSASRSAGAPVTVSATLTGVDGHTVVFDVEAHDAAAVLSGQHSRALVNRARFTRRLAPRPDSTGRQTPAPPHMPSCGPALNTPRCRPAGTAAPSEERGCSVPRTSEVTGSSG
ncbi:thioesterase family protein [Streptomyces cinereospinus]|uniref:Thioesterase family protein n=1 Tax=Streptomyces cinereospinus TaxID=285561 RepID=A0ABV5N621_9ACTN